jgi:hypothetical protein
MAAHKFVLVLVGMLALLAVRTEAACEFYRNNEFSQSTSQWPCSHRPIGANKLLNHVPAAKAKASHILMKDEDTLNAVKAEIDAGASFADKAKEHSTCPSGAPPHKSHFLPVQEERQAGPGVVLRPTAARREEGRRPRDLWPRPDGQGV